MAISAYKRQGIVFLRPIKDMMFSYGDYLGEMLFNMVKSRVEMDERYDVVRPYYRYAIWEDKLLVW